MSNQKYSPLTQQMQALDELYHTAQPKTYEVALTTVAKYLQQTLPDFTIALAEVALVGSERQADSGMYHVLLPIKRSAQ